MVIAQNYLQDSRVLITRQNLDGVTKDNYIWNNQTLPFSIRHFKGNRSSRALKPKSPRSRQLTPSDYYKTEWAGERCQT